MTIVVKKKLDKKKSEKIIASLPGKTKPIDLSQYAGKLEWKGDPLALQKKLRNE